MSPAGYKCSTSTTVTQDLTDVQSSAENGGSTLEAVDVPLPCDLSSDFPALEVLTLGSESEPNEALEVTPEDVADDEPTEEDDITDMHSSASQTPNRSSSDVSIEEPQDEVQPSDEDSQDDVLMDEALVAEQDLTDIELASLDDVEENTLNPADLPLPASPASTHSSEDCVLEVSRCCLLTVAKISGSPSVIDFRTPLSHHPPTIQRQTLLRQRP